MAAEPPLPNAGDAQAPICPPSTSGDGGEEGALQRLENEAARAAEAAVLASAEADRMRAASKAARVAEKAARDAVARERAMAGLRGQQRAAAQTVLGILADTRRRRQAWQEAGPAERARLAAGADDDGLLALADLGGNSLGRWAHVGLPTLRGGAQPPGARRWREDSAAWSLAQTDDELAARLYALAPALVGFDLAAHGMCIAGGAARAALMGDEHRGDTDIFLVGHTAATASQAIDALAAHLGRYHGLSGAGPTSSSAMDVFRTQLCVTFDHARRPRAPEASPARVYRRDEGQRFLWWKVQDEADPWQWPYRAESGLDDYEPWAGPLGPQWRVQVVLRLYATPAEVLHDFDIGACMVLWDGRQAWTTALGWLAAEQAISVVDLTVRRPGYERRLKKYYHQGYDLVLPELDAQGVREQRRWDGGWLCAYVDSVKDCGCCIDLRYPLTICVAGPSAPPSGPGDPSSDEPLRETAAERARQAAYDYGRADQEIATVYSSEVSRTGQNLQAAAAAHRAALAAARDPGGAGSAPRADNHAARNPSRGVRCAHARYSPGMHVLQIQPQLRPEVLESMAIACWRATSCTSIAATVSRTSTASVLGRLRRLLGEDRLDALIAAALRREPGHDSPEDWTQLRAACAERCAELAPYLTLPVEWMRLGMAHPDECGVELREWYGADFYRRDG